MIEKITETKTAILERIKKAVADDTKSISPEALEKMAMIVDVFDKTEDIKSMPKFDYEKTLEKIFEKIDIKEPKAITTDDEKPEEGV